MDSDSQPDKPPQEDFQGFTNVVGILIALVTLTTPIVSLVLFSAPTTMSDPLMSSGRSPNSRFFPQWVRPPVTNHWFTEDQDKG